MADWLEMCAAASARERVRARKLARSATLSEAEALRRTLTITAGSRSLATLILERRQIARDDSARCAARKQQQARAWQHKRGGALPDPHSWQGWFDGSAVPNPGRIGLGAVLRSPAGKITELSLLGGCGDSNQAEYLALIGLLELARQQQVMMLVIYGDSKIVLDDLVAPNSIAALQSYRSRARELIAQIDTVQLQWIPRARNGAADALSQRARPDSNLPKKKPRESGAW